MILVGNKNDLESQRQVTQDEALEYAIAIGAEYYECSALKNEGKFLLSIETKGGILVWPVKEIAPF